MILAFLTGGRADYGKLRPLMLASRDAGHQVRALVCGTHLDVAHGYTLIEVERDPWAIVHVGSAVAPVSPHGMADALAGVCHGVSRQLDGCDALVVHGDRVEAMGGALAGALANVPVVHVEAGDVSGGIDNALRASITPLASVHVARDIASVERLRSRGVDPKRIFVIGYAPPADMPTLDEVRTKYDLPAWERYGILALHPVTTGEEPPETLAREVCAAVLESGLSFVVLASNADHGSHLIERELAQLPRERFRRIPSMRHAHFARLLADAAVIVGNSSAGVIEAPLYGTPCVDVGARQRGRGCPTRLAQVERGHIGRSIRGATYERDNTLCRDARYELPDSWVSVLDAIERGNAQ